MSSRQQGVIYSGGDPCLTSYSAYAQTQTHATCALKANAADVYTKTQTDTTFATRASPTFTGTTTCNNLAVTGNVSGISKATLQLGSIDNTSDVAIGISTKTQPALNGKEDAFSIALPL